MKEKIDKAMQVVGLSLTTRHKPCVLCSFGKDSVAMLYLFRKMGIMFPVVFFRYPFCQEKYAYAEKLCRELKLELHQDIPPFDGSIVYGENDCEVMHHFMIGKSPLKLPVGRLNGEGEKICGKEKFLFRNYGTYNWPWDLVFHGHKASDKDNLIGKLKIDCDILGDSITVDYCFPIREWTDQDVWNFLESENAIIHDDRYEKVDGGWRERDDKTYNPDYFNYCVNCIDVNAGKTVVCPKNGLKLNNIGHLIPVTDCKKEMTYIKGE